MIFHKLLIQLNKYWRNMGHTVFCFCFKSREFVVCLEIESSIRISYFTGFAVETRLTDWVNWLDSGATASS